MPDAERSFEDPGFNDFLSAEMKAESAAGDTSSETPTEPAPAAAAPEVTETEQPAGGDTSPETPAAEWRFDSAEWDAAHPELVPYRKQLQGSFTKAQQELAADQAVQWARKLREVAAVSPAAAAQMLADEHARLLEQSAPPPVDEDPEEFSYYTDTEQQLARQNRALAARLERIEQQSQLASIQSQIDRQFGELETELGVKITAQERLAHLEAMAKEGIPFQATARLWKATHGWQHALERGRAEGERALRAKQGLPAAPSGNAPREAGSKPNPKEMSFDEFLARELAQ